MTPSNPSPIRLSDGGLATSIKAEGAFIAFAAGDALGWPQEIPSKTLGGARLRRPDPAFQNWTRRGGNRFAAFEEPVARGEYSDDTQLLLAVARSRCLAGESWWSLLTRTELPLWTVYERGGGGATKRAAGHWVDGHAPWKAEKAADRAAYFKAGGNGAAMRALPHAIHRAADVSPETLLREVALDAVATHGHPRAILGALLFAYAAWSLLRATGTVSYGEIVERVIHEQDLWSHPPVPPQGGNEWTATADSAIGETFGSLWTSVVDETIDALRVVEHGLGRGVLADDRSLLEKVGCFSASKGAGTVTTVAALYLCARYASQPEQAVLVPAFSHGADTDTLAAMSGGLAGCLSGTEWIPQEWLEVQDALYLRNMARSLATHRPADQLKMPDRHVMSGTELRHIETQLMSCRKLDDLGLFGAVQCLTSGVLTPLTRNSETRRVVLATGVGQKLYVTQTSKARPQHQPKLRDLSGPHSSTRTDVEVCRGIVRNAEVLAAASATHPELDMPLQAVASLLAVVVVGATSPLPAFVAGRALNSLPAGRCWQLSEGSSFVQRTLGWLLSNLKMAAAQGRYRIVVDADSGKRILIVDASAPSDADTLWRAQIETDALVEFCRGVSLALAGQGSI